MRTRYLLLAIATTTLGLAVHFRGSALPNAVRDMLGDALWAAMIFWIVALIAPTARRRWLVLFAIVICFAVELSQLIHVQWLERWRNTALGHLTLGSDFDGRDLFAYSAGILLAALLDQSFTRKHP